MPARSLHQAMSRGAGGGRARQLILHLQRQLILHLQRQLILHTAAGRQAGGQRQAGRQAEAGRQVAASSTSRRDNALKVALLLEGCSPLPQIPKCCISDQKVSKTTMTVHELRQKVIN